MGLSAFLFFFDKFPKIRKTSQNVLISKQLKTYHQGREKKMRWKIGIIAIAALLLFSGVVGAVGTQAGNCYQSGDCTQNQSAGNGTGLMQQSGSCYKFREQTQYQALPGPNGLMQQFRNRIRDMLGICEGGANLTELTGILTYDGTNFFIGEVEVHFGPSGYIAAAMSAVDYDNDGQFELIIDELLGLVGTTVTVEGHYQSDNWMSIFTINGEVYREPGQPVWALQHEWNWRYRHGQP